MPTNHTENYQLSQWEKTDKVQMEDFNADNAKIDGALASHEATLASLTEAVPKLGNCQIYSATYVGAANGGPVTHTFPHKPWLIIVTCLTGGSMMFWPGLPSLPENRYVTFTWNGNTVTWNGSSYEGMNHAGSDYQIIALLDMSD